MIELIAEIIASLSAEFAEVIFVGVIEFTNDVLELIRRKKKMGEIKNGKHSRSSKTNKRI